MKDLISMNRHFLLLARDASKDAAAGNLVTGLPNATLGKISQMSLAQIDALASTLPVAAFTFRFTPDEIDRLMSGQRAANAPAYALNVLAGASRA